MGERKWLAEEIRIGTNGCASISEFLRYWRCSTSSLLRNEERELATQVRYMDGECWRYMDGECWRVVTVTRALKRGGGYHSLASVFFSMETRVFAWQSLKIFYSWCSCLSRFQ